MQGQNVQYGTYQSVNFGFIVINENHVLYTKYSSAS